jgi:hypothetical protein
VSAIQVSTTRLKSCAGLKVRRADYTVATAKAGTAVEVGSATAEVRSTAPTEVSAATTTTGVPTTAAATGVPTTATAATPGTVGFSGAGHEGRDRYHGQDLEGPAEKSCITHLARHDGFTPSLRALSKSARAALRPSLD